MPAIKMSALRANTANKTMAIPNMKNVNLSMPKIDRCRNAALA
jgi:hypothetical protein